MEPRKQSFTNAKRCVTAERHKTLGILCRLPVLPTLTKPRFFHFPWRCERIGESCSRNAVHDERHPISAFPPPENSPRRVLGLVDKTNTPTGPQAECRAPKISRYEARNWASLSAMLTSGGPKACRLVP